MKIPNQSTNCKTSQMPHSAPPFRLRTARLSFALSLLFVFAGLGLVQPCTGTPFEWEPTGSLNTGRYRHTATLLPSGHVLVAGGRDSFVYLKTAELYDPATGSWSSTGSLNTERALCTATLLPSGLVLVAGGLGVNDVPLKSAELYDPASGSWSSTGSMGTGRGHHTATQLPSGQVLVAGDTLPPAVPSYMIRQRECGAVPAA